MVTAIRDDKYITRNISQFKVMDSSLEQSCCEEEENDDDLMRSNPTPVVAPLAPAS